MHNGVRVCGTLLLAALAGWAALVATELVLYFAVLPLLAMVLGSELLASLKAALDLGALTVCGWVAGRVGSPRVMAAAVLTAIGLALFDLTPYLPLNVPFALRLLRNAFGESRYAWSLLTTLLVHIVFFLSLFFGARRSRASTAPLRLGIDR